MSKRVIIAMSDTGGGHRAVSKAVGESLQRLGGLEEPPIVDLFAFGEKRTLADRMTRLYGPLIRTSPAAYGVVYHLSAVPALYNFMYVLNKKSVVHRARRILRHYKPDAVVSIHALVTRPFIDAARIEHVDIPAIVVVPDMVTIHRTWVEQGVKHYTAPTPSVVGYLERWGVSPSKITLTGLPVDRRFHDGRDGSDVRARLGLSRERLTVLLVAGGEGSGNLPETVRAIDGARLNLQLIVVCGKNKRAEQELIANPPSIPTKIVGFTSDMPSMIAASDIVISKGGPQTIAECLASGKPVLVTQLLPGQEKGNDLYVQENGAGFRVENRTKLIQVLSRLSADPDERARLAAAAQRLGQPDAADKVAGVILDLIGAIPRS